MHGNKKIGQDTNGTISKAIRREVIITVGYADDWIAPEFWSESLPKIRPEKKSCIDDK